MPLVSEVFSSSKVQRFIEESEEGGTSACRSFSFLKENTQPLGLDSLSVLLGRDESGRAVSGCAEDDVARGVLLCPLTRPVWVGVTSQDQEGAL